MYCGFFFPFFFGAFQCIVGFFFLAHIVNGFSPMCFFQCDDLEELEWLSNFVEESFSSGDMAPTSFNNELGLFGMKEESILHSQRGSISMSNESFHSTSPISVLESNNYQRGKTIAPPLTSSYAEPSPVPGRARSKRCRTAACFWNTRILSPEASESIFLESSSTTYNHDHDDADIFSSYYDHDDHDVDHDDDDDDDDDGDDECRSERNE